MHLRIKCPSEPSGGDLCDIVRVLFGPLKDDVLRGMRKGSSYSFSLTHSPTLLRKK